MQQYVHILYLDFTRRCVCILRVYILFFAVLSYIVFDVLSRYLNLWFCNISSTHGMSLAVGRVFAILLRACAALPAFLFLIQTARNFLTLAVPMMGKIGTVVPSDPIVAALVSLFVASMSVFPLVGCSLIDLFSPRYESQGYFVGSVKEAEKKSVRLLDMSTSGLLLVSLCVIIACVPLQPYSASRPKRLWIQHVQRSFKEGSYSISDAGVWIQGFDGLGLHPLRYDQSIHYHDEW